MFSSLSANIVIVFIILLVGTVARWREVLTKETTDGLCRVAIEVTLPFLYFHSLATGLSRELMLSIWPLPLLAIALTICSFLISWLVCRCLKLAPGRRHTFLFLATFGNYGFLAIPLIYALFSETGLVYIIVFNLGVTLLYWTIGVAILTGSRAGGAAIFKNLLNNATLAILLGLIVGVSAFALPKVILEASRLIGNTSIPLALIVVGSMLAQKGKEKSVSFKAISALVFCRLLLTPGLVILLLHNFTNLPVILRVLIVLQAAMPSASTTPMLINRFGGDQELAASGVFFTTLLSIITVPLFVSLALR